MRPSLSQECIKKLESKSWTGIPTTLGMDIHGTIGLSFALFPLALLMILEHVLWDLCSFHDTTVVSFPSIAEVFCTALYFTSQRTHSHFFTLSAWLQFFIMNHLFHLYTTLDERVKLWNIKRIFLFVKVSFKVIISSASVKKINCIIHKPSWEESEVTNALYFFPQVVD